MIAGGDSKLPFGNLPRLILAVGFDRGRAHSIPRVGFGGFTLGVHAGAWDLQHQRQGTHSLAEPDAAVVSMSCSVWSTSTSAENGSFSSAIADQGKFWWNERKPDERSLWQTRSLPMGGLPDL